MTHLTLTASPVGRRQRYWLKRTEDKQVVSSELKVVGVKGFRL